MNSSIATFGRRIPASPVKVDRRGTMRTDVGRFLSAFVGGFVFFSVLLL